MLFMLLFLFVVISIDAADAYGSTLKGRLSDEERGHLLDTLIRRAYKRCRDVPSGSDRGELVRMTSVDADGSRMSFSKLSTDESH